MENTLHIATIQKLHELAGISAPKHQLFSVHRIENLRNLGPNFPKRLSYGFYSIGLKKDLRGYLKYGRTHYDFQQGALGFTAPFQVMEFNSDLMNNGTGWILLIHENLIANSLSEHQFDTYAFFNYDVNEGLHLSEDEENALQKLFENIETEYHLPIDRHSKNVVLSNISLLLAYSQRYYHRQFIMRNEVKPDVLTTFEKELKQYYIKSETEVTLPTVDYFANALHLSANYLSDLLKATTGKTALEHIHMHLVSTAKKRLLISNNSISGVGYSLGFEYPQYFSRLFKNKTGETPSAFRRGRL